MVIDDLFDVVLENCPASSKWREDSFLGELEERGRWNYSKYWRLECALYSLGGADPDGVQLAAVFKLYARLSRLFSSHFDSYDIFEIKGLARVEVLDLQERIDLVVDGVFIGEMPDKEDLSPKNPNFA